MNSPDPVPAPQPGSTAIPWYRSPQQISNVTAAVSALIALFPKVGQALNLSNASDVSTAVTIVFGAIAVIAPGVGTALRARSKLQPLTLTKAAAEVHPVTLAAEKTAAAMVQAGIPTTQATAAVIAHQAAAAK